MDGGGTKTAFCLIDADGTVLAEARTAGIYYLAQGIDIVEPLLRQGIDEVCDVAGTSVPDLAYAFFGIPCYGEISGDVPVLDELPRRILGEVGYTCGNDMICGWAASLGGVDGINVVAGTGSIAYGEHAGQHWRAGGWSELFGDEGSGYWVAVQGLGAFSRMADGRRPESALAGEMRRELALSTDLDAIDVVMNRWHGDRGKIAGLSKVVTRAADAGDPTATGILADAGRELALHVEAGARALGFGPAQAVPVSYSGGMFTSAHVLASFREALLLGSHAYDLREPLLPPHVGAAVYAARLAGHTIAPGRISAGPTLERLS
ncbi:N-acetylglucosamine kinase [Amycolatopsis sp. WQ 127309]|uniref:N-acetylglucosamine kinase n=1 Tax=Amycolatopsis sp. WQ 127309 TaxID=2932773 RepID=UPI001FF613FB|nr:BadF/BadG/BcrA/BcrD ATPase family protein [Amycolatopsis sp. WQ 127309]UOZ05558.1 N-acetylglucosamine kinase [Amycolatopsis sp. WQ 127309]